MANRPIKLSASSIQAFQACPTRFRLGYVEGIRRAEDTDALRVGTNWHMVHDEYHQAKIEGKTQDEAFGRVLTYLVNAYEDVPANKDPEAWFVEREILYRALIGYVWYFESDPIEVVANELPFDLPVFVPGTTRPMRGGRRVGKIDHIALWQGRMVNVERKSTSRSIEAGSDYWTRLQKDTQVSMYALAWRDLMRAGLVPDAVQSHSDFHPDRFGNTMYDVWKKPSTMMKALSQKDTATFAESGEYCGETFTVELGALTEAGHPETVLVDGEPATVVPGARGWAIRETIRMYGARYLADIVENPEAHFARKEIPRTKSDITQFEQKVYNILQAMLVYRDKGCWYENENQCRATYHCEYIPICYGPGAEKIAGDSEPPPGFKRLYPVTIKANGE